MACEGSSTGFLGMDHERPGSSWRHHVGAPRQSRGASGATLPHSAPSSSRRDVSGRPALRRRGPGSCAHRPPSSPAAQPR
eukprot:2300296-Pyramimonas_sp.AAC.1